MFQFFDHTGDIGVDIDAADPGALFADAACAFSETITDREALAGRTRSWRCRSPRTPSICCWWTG